MNWLGPGLGLATLAIIGLGFWWVVRCEYYLGRAWWPYVMGLGLALVGLSVWVSSVWGSALLGIFGGSLVWGATELDGQAERVARGWYPANPGRKPQPPLANVTDKGTGGKS